MNLEELRKRQSLEGKVAIVTGASRPNGQGLAAARALAIRGASVVLTDLAEESKEFAFGHVGMGSAEQLASAVEEVRALGAEAIGIPVDVTKKDQIRACVEKTVETFGGVDILINNAGVFVGCKAMEDLTSSDWDVSCRVHMEGVANFSIAVVPEMRKRGGGVIVNNASVLGLGAVGGVAAYTASKFGMVGLTKSMADEYGPRNIRVNAVCPGNIWTDVSQAEAEILAGREGFGGGGSPDDVIQAMKDMSPLGRYATPDEIGEALVFLATPSASFIHGATLRVDGGVKGALF